MYLSSSAPNALEFDKFFKFIFDEKIFEIGFEARKHSNEENDNLSQFKRSKADSLSDVLGRACKMALALLLKRPVSALKTNVKNLPAVEKIHSTSYFQIRLKLELNSEFSEDHALIECSINTREKSIYQARLRCILAQDSSGWMLTDFHV